VVTPPVAAWILVCAFYIRVPGEPLLLTMWWAGHNTLTTPPLYLSLLGGIAGGGGLAALFLHQFKSAFKGARFRKHLRGVKIATDKKLSRQTRDGKSQQITVANIPLPTNIENLHLLLAGGTGSGKSTIINEICKCICIRRERYFVIDPGGEMLSKFYREGKDKILNPYDNRTAGWSFFNEIRHEYDFDRYSHALVPKSNSSDAEEWLGYGRLLLREVSKKLWSQDNADITELNYWCCNAPPEELFAFVKGTEAESLFGGNEKGSKALQSARFVLSDKLSPHTKMPDGDFALRDWLADPNAGNLFITWREDMVEALRPLIAAWTDSLFVSILSLPPDPNRRIWGLMDELASLGKLESLEDALTKGRKNGFAGIGAIQSTSQLADLYGKEGAQTLRSCFSSLVALRVSRTDPETAEDISKALGLQEVERDRDSSSRGKGMRSSSSIEVKEERIISPSELMALPDLTGYVSLVGDYPVARFETQYVQFKKRYPAFVERAPMFAEVR